MLSRGVGRVSARLVSPSQQSRSAMNVGEAKRRMKAVDQIGNITSAMKMVATAKLRYVESAMQIARPFGAVMQPIFNTETDKTGDIKKMCYAVVTSDKGLCGSVNTQISRHVRSHIRVDPDEPPTDRPVIAEDDHSIVLFGEKGRVQLGSTMGGLYTEAFTELDRTRGFSWTEIAALSDGLIKHDFDKANIVYNWFKNVATFRLQEHEIYSLELTKNDVGHLAHYEIEGDEDSVMQNLWEYRTGSLLFEALIDAAACEQGSRMTAMEQSSTNASDMAKFLKLKFNQARQAKITTELLELTSGAECAKQMAAED